MRKFLGIVGLSHEHTRESRTLTEMTRKRIEMQWEERQIKAFEYLCCKLKEDGKSMPPNTLLQDNTEIEISSSRDEEN